VGDDPLDAAPAYIRHAEGLISGTVVCGAVIAAGAGHIDAVPSLVAAILLTVGAYWLAHLYSATVAGLVQHEPAWPALRRGIAHSWVLLAASLIPVAILLTVDALGAGISTAARVALVATIGLLALYGGLAGHRGGLGARGIALCAIGGGSLGVLLVLMKSALH